MKELLIPVGNMECLKVAIHSGADAVYLGGKRFGARAFAGNFDNEEMIEAINMCHIYGVKIYVTVNTLVHETELEEALEYVKFLYVNNVDAIIVQDIGLISLIRKLYPNLEVHASTQMHSTNEDTFKLLEELGVTRVVLARELSVNDIDAINSPLEKEAFIHGAICISYSGECLFSSVTLNRSGNRGECAQLCRLPYKLVKNNETIEIKDEYLLSTKELNTSRSIKDIFDSSIYSLKIEGRMKSPEYVGCVTKLYRDLLDKYYTNRQLNVNEEIYKDLLGIFNRKYTKGFILNATNEELMNIETPNHLGLPLGKVTEVSKRFIKIELSDDINQEDGIRFCKSNTGLITNFIYDLSGKLINGAKKGESIYIDNKVNASVGELVNKTFDKKIALKYRNPKEKKIEITINFKAKENEEIEITATDGVNTVFKNGTIPQRALSRPVDMENIKTCLNKLGNTPFSLKNVNIDLDDNLFISLKEINELRRSVIDLLIEKRIKSKKELIINTFKEETLTSNDSDMSISVLCRTEDQVLASNEAKVNTIYVTDKYLYNKYKYLGNIYLRSYRNGIKQENEGLATELGSLYRNKNNKINCDYFLNITNHATIDYLSRYSNKITLSPELTNIEISQIMKHYNYNNSSIEFIIYTTLELMLLKYCPLNLLLNKEKICTICNNVDKYYLQDRNGILFPLIQEKGIHLTHLMNSETKDLISNANYYKELGIKNYRIEFLYENKEEAKNIINQLQNKIN